MSFFKFEIKRLEVVNFQNVVFETFENGSSLANEY